MVFGVTLHYTGLVGSFKISEWSQTWGMAVSLCSNIVQTPLLTWITQTDRRSVTNQSFKLMISRLYWPKLFIFRSWSGCDCEGYEYFTFIKQHISRNQQVLVWLPDNEDDKMISRVYHFKPDQTSAWNRNKQNQSRWRPGSTLSEVLDQLASTVCNETLSMYLP